MKDILSGILKLAGGIFELINTDAAMKNVREIRDIQLELNEEWENYPELNHSKIESLQKRIKIFMDAAIKEQEILLAKKNK